MTTRVPATDSGWYVLAGLPREGVIRCPIIAWDVDEEALADFKRGVRRTVSSNTRPVFKEEAWALEKGVKPGSGHIFGAFHPIHQPEPKRFETKAVRALNEPGFAPLPGREWPLPESKDGK